MNDQDVIDVTESKEIAPGWITVLALMSTVFIIVSTRAGKELSLGEVLYDLGIVGLTVAVIEIFILRVLQRLSNPPDPWLSLLQEFEQLRANLDELNEENRDWLLNWSIDEIKRSLDETQRSVGTLTALVSEHLVAVREQVDKNYAEERELQRQLDSAFKAVSAREPKTPPPPEESAERNSGRRAEQ